MKDGIASRTAYGAGRLRAAHQNDHPRVFDDPVAVRFLRPQDAQAVQDKTTSGGPFARGLRMAIAARSRLVEDSLHEAVARGVTQYVVLGAGFDTFASARPTSPRSCASSRWTTPTRRPPSAASPCRPAWSCPMR